MDARAEREPPKGDRGDLTTNMLATGGTPVFFSESTSVVIGLVWAGSCVGLATAPSLASLGRGLWERAKVRFGRRRRS